jgi:hypothetical protein
MVPTYQAECNKCGKFRPLFLSGNHMVCDKCATKPPAFAMIGPFVWVAVMAFLAVATVVGLMLLHVYALSIRHSPS